MDAAQCRAVQFVPNTPAAWEGRAFRCRHFGADICEHATAPRFRFYDGSQFVGSDDLRALKAYARETFIPAI